jgi:ATP-dependent DNA ligase
MRLSRRPEPFDSDDYLFELKLDGFRSLAYIENGQCDLVSRNGNTFRNFKALSEWIGENLRVESALLDGEIACVDDSGRSVFNDLLFRRRECVFCLRPAFPERRRHAGAAVDREKGAVETAAAR